MVRRRRSISCGSRPVTRAFRYRTKGFKIGTQAALLPMLTSKTRVMEFGTLTHDRSRDSTCDAVATLAIAIPPVIMPRPIRQQRPILLWVLMWRFRNRTTGKAAQRKSVMKERTPWAINMFITVCMEKQWPPVSPSFQTLLTGWHWKIVRRKRARWVIIRKAMRW